MALEVTKMINLNTIKKMFMDAPDSIKSPKLRLIAVLAVTKEFVIRSEKEGWPCEDPNEIASELDQMISYVFEPEKYRLPEHCLALYLPTGAIQEIAMSNGWHSEYMELAAEFDQVGELLEDDG